VSFKLISHSVAMPTGTIKRLNLAADGSEGELVMYDSTGNGVTEAVAGPGLTLDKVAGILQADVDVSEDAEAMVLPLTPGALVETLYNSGTAAVGEQVEFNEDTTVHGVVAATGGAILGVVEEVIDATAGTVKVRITGGVQYPEYGMVIQKVAVEADASAGQDFDALFSGEIVQAWTHCTAANGSGTLTVRSETNAITDAMACAVLDAVDKADTIDQTYKGIVAGETYNVLANGAADRGEVYLLIMLG
jgi:hypothetical protein